MTDHLPKLTGRSPEAWYEVPTSPSYSFSSICSAYIAAQGGSVLTSRGSDNNHLFRPSVSYLFDIQGLSDD
jgi:hypothetical protein